MKKDDLPKIVSVFPLSNFIIFPKTTVPLNIFEPRYIAMVESVIGTHRMIGMIPFRDIRKSKKTRNTSLFKEVFTPSRKSALLNQDSKRKSRQLENWFSNILQGPGIGSEDQTEYLIDSIVSCENQSSFIGGKSSKPQKVFFQE